MRARVGVLFAALLCVVTPSVAALDHGALATTEHAVWVNQSSGLVASVTHRFDVSATGRPWNGTVVAEVPGAAVDIVFGVGDAFQSVEPQAGRVRVRLGDAGATATQQNAVPLLLAYRVVGGDKDGLVVPLRFVYDTAALQIRASPAAGFAVGGEDFDLGAVQVVRDAGGAPSPPFTVVFSTERWFAEPVTLVGVAVALLVVAAVWDFLRRR